MNPIFIEATTLPDAWFQCVYSVLEYGKQFKIDKGSYEGQDRLEFDYITIRIKQPWHEPLLPKIPEQYNIPDPVDQNYLDSYLPYLMTGEKEEGESYTYGERLNKCEIDHRNYFFFKSDSNNYAHPKCLKDIYINDILDDNILDRNCFLSQMELLIWTYKKYGFRNNQMCLQIAQPSDMLLQDPPCLRHIDTRIQDNKLHFFPYFRSWDLFSGFPANLAAIELMKQYIALEVGVENGEIIANSKGLHIYNYVIELSEILRGKTIKEFENGR